MRTLLHWVFLLVLFSSIGITSQAQVVYSCDFETAANDAEWVLTNGTCPNQWAIGSAVNNTEGGSRSLYISNDNGASNEYGNGHTFVLAYKELALTAGTHNISYDWKCKGETGWDFARVALVPTSNNIDAGTSMPSGFTKNSLPTEWNAIALDDGVALPKMADPTIWETISKDVVIEAGSYMLVFFWRNDNSYNYTPPIAIDNIVVTKDNCPKPIGIVASARTATSATIEWVTTDDATWQLEYGPAGFTVGSGTTATATQNSYTFSGLTGGRAYDVYIKTVVGTKTSAASKFTFNTLCELPYNDDFENDVSNNAWVIGSDGTYDPQWSIGTATNNTANGSKSLYVSNDDGATNSLTSENARIWTYKEFYLTAGTYNIEYDYIGISHADAWPNDYMRAALVPESISTFDEFYSEGLPDGCIAIDNGASPNSAAWTRYETEVAITTAGIYKLAFYWKSGQSYWGDGNTIDPSPTVDNIEFSLVTCPRPSTFVVSSRTTNNAVIGWTEKGTATIWQVEYGVAGFEPGTGTKVMVAQKPFTITGLSAAQQYDVYIRSIVGADTSKAYKASFSTVGTLPYIDDFETTTLSGWITDHADASIVNQWYIGSATNNTEGGSKSLYISNDQGITNAYSTDGTHTKIYREFYLEPGQYTISYDFKSSGEVDFSSYYGTTYYDFARVWLIPDNVNFDDHLYDVDGNTQPSSWISLDGGIFEETTTWVSKEFEISVSSAGIYKFLLYWQNDSYAYNPPTAIDNIEFKVLRCPRPTDFVVNERHANNVKVDWTEHGTATAWLIEYGPKGFTPGSGTTVNVYQKPYTLTGLENGKDYDLYIRSTLDGEMSKPLAGSVSTINEGIPYIEDFEATNSGDSWHYIVDGDNEWSVGAAVNNTQNGSKSLYISNDEGVSNAYTSNSSSISGVYKEYRLDTGYYKFSYDWKSVGTEDAFFRAVLVPEDMTVENGLYAAKTNSLPYGWIATDGGKNLNDGNNWHNQEMELYIEESGIYKIAFVWRNYSQYEEPLFMPAAIDNIELDRTTCIMPSDMVVSNLSQTTANIAWTENGEATAWKLEYGPQGFVRGSGTILNITDTAKYAFTGLNANQVYDVYIQSNCGESLSVGLHETFRTFGVHNVLPYEDDFENAEKNAEWVFVHDVSGNHWCIDTAVNNTEGGEKAMYITNDNGTSAAYTMNKPTTAVAYKEFSLTAGIYNASFDWLCNGESSYDYMHVALVPATEEFEVGIAPLGMYVNSVPSNWIQLDEGKTNQQTTWKHVLKEFTLQESGNYRLVIFWLNDYSTGANPPAQIDNLIFKVATCPRPSDYRLTSLTSSGAGIGWTENGTATSWNIEYGVKGFIQGEGSLVNVSEPTYLFAGLDANTAYDVYIQSDNGDETSLWLSGTFKTLCEDQSLPYFADYESLSGYEIPDCWMAVAGSASVYYSTSDAYEGYKSLRINDNGIIASPRFEIAGNQIGINFNAKAGNVSNSGKLEVCFVTDVVNMDYTVIDEIVPIDANYHVYNYNLSTLNLPAPGHIVFRQVNSTYSSFYIDELNIYELTDCAVPTNLVVSAIADTTAVLSWEGGAGENVSIRYGSGSRVETATAATIAAGATTVNLTGLYDNTTYTVWGRGNCANDTTYWVELGRFRTLPSCTELGNVEVCNIAQTSAVIRWDFSQQGVDGVNTVMIKYKSGTATTWDSVMDVAGPEYLLTNLVKNTTYNVMISTGCHNRSLSFTTADDPHPGEAIGNGEDDSYYVPLVSNYGYSYVQSLYPAELLRGTDTLKGIAFTSSSQKSPYIRDIVVYMANTTKTEFSSTSDYIPLSELTQVYSGEYNIRNNNLWDTIMFTTPFVVEANSNIVIAIDDNTDSWKALYFTTHAGSSISYYEDNNDIAPVNPLANSTVHERINSYVADIRFVAEFSPITCLPPTVAVASTTENSATLSWAAGLDETSWSVSYRVSGTEDWTEAIATTSETSYTVTGLTSGTTYEFRVGSLCSETDCLYGYATGRTGCGLFTIPYIESFATNTVNPCWYVNNKNLNPYNYPSVYGNAVLEMPVGSYVILPTFDVAIPSLQLSFTLEDFRENTRLIVGVVADPDDISTFEVIDTIAFSDEQYDVELDILLQSYAGTNTHIAMKVEGGYLEMSMFKVLLKQTHLNTYSNNLAWGTVDGGGKYNHGSEVTITAVPARGYHFVNWSDENTEITRTFNLTQDTAFTANFAVNQYDVVAESEDATLGTVVGGGTYDFGTAVVMEAQPIVGYHFTMWNDSVTENPRTFVLENDTTFTASFEINQYEFTVVSDNPELGSVTGDSVYNHGTTATIEATPIVGYHFVKWADGNEENPRNVVATQDSVFVATFAINRYQVEVVSNDILMGTVAGAGEFDHGTTIEVTATATEGYHFDMWNDSVTENPRSLVLTQDTSLTAVFELNSYQVVATSNNDEWGAVVVDGTYDFESEMVLTATPTEGYHFVSWNDGNEENPRTFVLMQDTTFEATFAINEYPVTVAVNNEAWGTVTGADTYEHGATAVIEATPQLGYHFVGWSDEVEDNPRTITVTQDSAFTAMFAINEYQIEVASANVELGSVTGEGVYDHGTSVIIEAVPAVGHHFVSWNDGNEENPRTIVATQDSAFTASFAVNQYVVTALCNINDYGSVTGGAVYDYGTTVTLEATAVPNYHFVSWNDGNIENPRSFIVAQDTSFTATFAINEYQITINSNNSEYGIVTGSGTYTHGSSVMMEANPIESYHFVSWSDGETSNPRIVRATQDSVFTAIFEINEYEVVAQSANNAFGTVLGGGTYEHGATATITANPVTNYHFVRWNDGYTENPRNVVVTSNATYIATFAIDEYQITATSNNDAFGIVTGSGVYYHGQNVTLVAVPQSNYHFVSWNDGNTENPRMVTATEAKTYTATFAINEYQITVSSNNGAFGTVAGSGTYTHGESAVISATPLAGYHFVSWSDGYTDNPRTVTVTANAMYTASFAINQYTVHAESANITQGTVIGSGVYNHGAMATLIATPLAGYHFVNWNDGNVENPRTISVTQDTTCTATFAVNEYQVNVMSINTAYGTVTGGGTYGYGEEITIQAIPQEGYHFVSWNDGYTDNPRTITVTSSATYTASFAVNEYRITVLSNDNSYGMVTGSGTYEYGETVTITATPREGYLFESWNDGNTNASRTITVRQSETYTANFKLDENTGIEDVDALAEVSVYPNPTRGIITISAENIEHVYVYDMVGKKLAQFNNQNIIDLSNLTTGQYVLRIETTDGYVIRKVVKK